MAYDAHQWTDFLVAIVGASASLTGLLFVAISINLRRILQYRNVGARAAETLALLLLVVFDGACALAPQSIRGTGIEILGLSGSYVLVVGSIQIHHGPEHAEDPWYWFFGRVVSVQIGALLLVVTGGSLVAGGGGGLYWLLAGAVACLAGGVFNAWILLVEVADEVTLPEKVPVPQVGAERPPTAVGAAAIIVTGDPEPN